MQHIIYCSCSLLSGSFVGIGGSYFNMENRILRNTRLLGRMMVVPKERRAKHLIPDGVSDKTPQKNLTIIRS